MLPFNPWIGCTKVSAGCKFCYADVLDHRWGNDSWGPGKPRRVTSDANWNKPVQWNRAAEKAGKRTKVFCASLADVFDAEGPPDARERLWKLIENTPFLDWQLLTKRPENIVNFVPKKWLDSPLYNVWYGTSVEDNKVRDRIEILSEIPAEIRFLSAEPLIGPIDFPPEVIKMNWIIFGGESGPNARPMDLNWVRDGIKVCGPLGIAIFVKQLGEVWAKENGFPKSKGEDPDDWPLDLVIRDFPR